ncbi:innate immunity activator protein isoform X2 [Echinops telfairi]|uniref:Innate immunity activator protein isoform X2 n=1 Tax=Echinops telfairi TaxID=9371 RepID=A0AC55DR88_ECHTE|nr:innate immunity activator protein isoform X2 [Echinops telfairi]
MLHEEKKLRQLERCVGEQRRNSATPPDALPLGRELSASDDSSLSDGLLLEEGEWSSLGMIVSAGRLPPGLGAFAGLAPESFNGREAFAVQWAGEGQGLRWDVKSISMCCSAEEPQGPKPPPEAPATPSRPPPPQSLEGLQPAGPETGGLERAPIQNSPWKETSLDHPYEKPRKSSELSSESSSPATTPQDGPSMSSLWLPEPAPFHGVPTLSIPGQQQGHISAPATPEMQGRRGQSQSLRVDAFRVGLEGRGRSAFPRRRPTHYTVTVPDSCFAVPKPPVYHSCSEDSGSDVSSISHPTSQGSSSPDISFLRPLSPLELPHHHGAWVLTTGGRELVTHYPQLLLPPGYFPQAGRYVVVAESHPAAYEEEGAPLRYQRLVAAHSRIVRTPSLKDSPAGRGLSKAAVTEELRSWHERARLRSIRPHSLDRQGAFRVRSLPPGREGFPRALGARTQVPTVCVLRRSPEGAPVQVFVPENGEIISQV